MRVAFLHSDKPREGLLADAFLSGAAKHGHQVSAWTLSAPPAPGEHEVVCMVGVKSREIFRAHGQAGAKIIYLDKGYSRHKSTSGERGWEYWRFAVNSHHPTWALGNSWPGDRWSKLGFEMLPWREAGDHILIAGSSAKYHEFYGLKEPTTWAKDIVRTLRAVTDRPLVYRPKPSWKEAVHITKTRFSALPESMLDVLTGAWVTVTHGSNACFESVVYGIPSIVLGDGVAKPLSSTSLDDIDAPRLASDDERMQWARALAYHQFTRAEFAAGEAWEVIRGEMHA